MELVPPEMSEAPINSLGRYPLSVVLAFLPEFDGTCLLQTQTQWTRTILPLFRLKFALKINKRKNRHRYRIFPVQDPETLLDRLNTRRLGQRRQQKYDENTTPCYEYNQTTSELAWSEWNRQQQQTRDNNTPLSPISSWPTPLELLRFLPTPSDIVSAPTEPVAVLASYPRSGNTLLRTLLERTTGVVTGSDTRPDRPLSKSLALDFDLVGEGVTHHRQTFITKTHFPERCGYPNYAAGKAILLVRNPFDAIDSYWNLNLTNTHTETVTDQVYKSFPDKFEGLVKNEMAVWVRFHHYWLMQAVTRQFPLLLVRFEDLIKDPAKELARILRFVHETATLSEFWMNRIRKACSTQSTCTMGSYRPRSAVGGIQSIGKSLRKNRYSKELLKELHCIARREAQGGDMDLLHLFSYDVYRQSFPSNFVDDDDNNNNETPEMPKGINGAEVLSGPTLSNSGVETSRSETTVQVNDGSMVRANQDPYGRPMREWRHRHTNNDRDPFPIVTRASEL